MSFINQKNSLFWGARKGLDLMILQGRQALCEQKYLLRTYSLFQADLEVVVHLLRRNHRQDLK